MFTPLNTVQGIYTSLVNENKDVLCMDFNPTSDRYPEPLIQSSFERELRYINRLRKYPWAPELLEVSANERKLYIKWYDNTCEDRIPNDYAAQLLFMCSDLYREQIYKPSFYPKYFYTDNMNRMHMFNFYTAFDYSEQPLNVNFYSPILNGDRKELVDKISQDGLLDVKLLMKYAFTEYINWPNNILKDIYKKIYE